MDAVLANDFAPSGGLTRCTAVSGAICVQRPSTRRFVAAYRVGPRWTKRDGN